jgi:hypothetical protein
MTTEEKKTALTVLSHLIDAAPDYGEVGIILHLHGKILDRIEERRAEAFKAKPRGPYSE